jgi:glycosyltransferase involved in cell wall biosynthesis
MYKGYKISVVVPAFNEQFLIEDTLNGIPSWIDHIYVIDDGSSDNTYNIVKRRTSIDDKISLIKHQSNKGVGASIVEGYKYSLNDDNDVTIVIGGDNQMDPKYMPILIDPIISKEVDYTKGNRLSKISDLKGMSVFRKIGNFILTFLTKLSSGYWGVMDPQNGYTAISKECLKVIDLNSIYPYYGYVNDILTKLNINNFRVLDVSIPARYGREKSKINYPTYIIKVSILLLNNFLYRLKTKYLLLNPHPIFFLYFYSILVTILSLILIIVNINLSPFILSIFISGLVSFLIGLMFDIKINEKLSVKYKNN